MTRTGMSLRSEREAPVAAPPVAIGRAPTSWLAVVIPAVLATVLGLIELAGRSLWIDESATVAIASQHGDALWRAIAHDGGNMAGYYLGMHVLIGLFGAGPFAIRLPSVIGAGLATAAVALLAERLFGVRVAWFAGLLSAVSLPGVFWAQDARSYALMTAFVAGSYAAFVALLRATTAARLAVAWIAYVVMLVAALYMSYVAALIIPAQLVVVLGTRSRWPRVLSALGATAVCCVPLAAIALHRGSGQLFWVPRPSLDGIVSVLQSLTAAGYQPNFSLTATADPLLVATVVVLVAAGCVGLRSRRVTPKASRRLEPGDLLVAAWCSIPFGLALVESFVAQPIFSERNLLVGVPGVSLALGRVLAHPRVPRLAGVGALGLALVARGAQLWPTYGQSPENWAAATAQVLHEASPGDCLVFYPQDGEMAFSYYARLEGKARSTPLRVLLPSGSLESVVPHVEQYSSLSRSAVATETSGCRRVWLVASHQGLANGPPTSQADYRRYLDLEAELSGSFPVVETTRIGWAAVIVVERYSR